jgi:hypothetical protein
MQLRTGIGARPQDFCLAAANLANLREVSMASRLWRVMQIIEANRYWAEQLDAAASTADPTMAPLLADIADQRREFAEQIYELFRGQAQDGSGRRDAA